MAAPVAVNHDAALDQLARALVRVVESAAERTATSSHEEGGRPSVSMPRNEETALLPEDGFSDSPHVRQQGKVS